MFIPVLENLADAGLKAKWLTKAKNCELLGTYAQTEMGHGSLSFECGLWIYSSIGRNSCIQVFLQCEVVVARTVLDLRNNIN